MFPPLVRRVLAFVGLGLGLVMALVSAAKRRHEPLPVLGQVPTFHLVDAHGQPFTDASMRGHPSVVDFFFTRCLSSCPRLTARMAQLQGDVARRAPSVKLVSISVDPENDTPEVLADYAARNNADRARWSFVTGPLDDVERAVIQGFKMSGTKVYKNAKDYDVIHGDWFVLVDASGNIRAYCPTGTAKEYGEMLAKVERL
ncbi:MAG TPA: SCO family protein [Polyangiaceae bacterium]|jgi:protein SCO1/2